MRETGVTGRQLSRGFLSISSDSSQDAAGHRGAVSVSVCLSRNPSRVDHFPSQSAYILNRSRTDCVSLQESTASLLTNQSASLQLTETTERFLWRKKSIFLNTKMFIKRPLPLLLKAHCLLLNDIHAQGKRSLVFGESDYSAHILVLVRNKALIHVKLKRHSTTTISSHVRIPLHTFT